MRESGPVRGGRRAQLADDGQAPSRTFSTSVEHADVRSTLWAVRGTAPVDLDEAFVGRVPERPDHGGAILGTLETPRTGIDGVELGSAVPADDRLASGHDSIVGAGARPGQHDVPRGSRPNSADLAGMARAQAPACGRNQGGIMLRTRHGADAIRTGSATAAGTASRARLTQ